MQIITAGSALNYPLTPRSSPPGYPLLRPAHSLEVLQKYHFRLVLIAGLLAWLKQLVTADNSAFHQLDLNAHLQQHITVLSCGCLACRTCMPAPRRAQPMAATVVSRHPASPIIRGQYMHAPSALHALRDDLRSGAGNNATHLAVVMPAAGQLDVSADRYGQVTVALPDVAF